MANRYWVGGAGTWVHSSTMRWSETSGGSPGASAPVSGDVAIFDTNSGTSDEVVTLDGTVECSGLSMTSMRLTAAEPSRDIIRVFGGNITARYFSFNGETHIEGSASVSSSMFGTTRIKSNSTFGPTTGGLNLGNISLEYGAFDLAAFTTSCTSFTIVNNGSAKFLIMGANSVLQPTTFTNNDPANFNPVLDDASLIFADTFTGGGESYKQVRANIVYSANTFTQLELGFHAQLQAGLTQTITGTLVIPEGTSLMSTSTGSQATLSCSGTSTYRKLTVQDLVVSPLQYVVDGTNNGNNSGWSFVSGSNNLFFGSNF